MELVIKSPFIPLFFRQKIFYKKRQMGYLAATHRIGQLKGNQSYQAKFNRTIVSLIENKRENSNRNWSIQVENVGFRESKGLVTMMSGIVDTVNDNMTEYGIIFNGLSYS